METLYTILCASIVISGVHGNSFSQHEVTIKTERGQIYHCVDFYKQTAFNRSLLKTLSSQVTRATLASLQGRNHEVEGIGLPGGGCPFGTVPILHLESNDVVNYPTILNSDNTGCTAVIRTRANDPNKKFLGSDASVTIYKPQVQSSQWSSSRVKLLNGPDSIEAGWMVNPDLFNDKEPHLYAKFTAGGNGCINLQCPGFVQVSKDVPLGYIPEKYSTIGGQLYTWDISIDKHADDGNWWLSISHGKYVIGYWPKSIFTALADVANQVEWGGETDNPQLELPIPEMGDGLRAEYNTKVSAFFDHITISDQTSRGIIPSDTEKYMNCLAKYQVLDYGDQGERWGRIIFYGGPTMS